MFVSRVGNLLDLSPSTPSRFKQVAERVAKTFSSRKRSDPDTSAQVPELDTDTDTDIDTDDSKRKIMVAKKSDDSLLIAADSATSAAVQAFIKDNVNTFDFK